MKNKIYSIPSFIIAVFGILFFNFGKRHIPLFLIAVLLIPLQQCKKDNPVSTGNITNPANGKVIDAVTNTGVQGAYVALFASGGSIGNPTRTLVKDTITDANGNFSFPTNLQGDEVQATAKKYYDSQVYLIDQNSYKQSHIITLDPQSYLKLHIVNKQKIYYLISFDFAVKGAEIILNGFNVDTVITGAVFDATTKQISYGLMNSTVQKVQYLPITPIRFDTTFVQINY